MAPIRILHLDDNPLDAELVTMALNAERSVFPTSVTYVQSEEEYLAALERKEFDLILSDYRMPGFDGDQALRAAQRICPEIPFIMVTGELGEERVIETLKRGATDYVLKDRIFRLLPAITRALAEAENTRNRRAAEEEVRKVHRQNAEILESIQDAFFAMDKNQKVTYVNRRAEEVLGKRREDFIGKYFWDVFPDLRGTNSHTAITRAYRERVAVHYEVLSPVFHVWVEAHVYPAAEGGVSIFFRDITERKRAEEAIRLSEEKFALAFANNPAAIALTRLEDGLFYDVNDTWLELMGYRREEAVGHSSRQMDIWPTRESAARFVQELQEKGRLTGWEQAFLKKSGERFIAQLAAQVLTVQGEKLILSALVDITARKRAEEALRESEERVRRKMESVLSPEGDLGQLELADLIDSHALQKLMDEFYALSRFPLSILDMKGKLLVGVGWQQICTNFHRVNAETCRHCLESDLELAAGVPRGEFRLYKCKNNLWDVATPIIVDGKQLGNVFSGQFFFDDEVIDRELFRSQARLYGFEEEEYLAALDRVPRLSRATVERGMAFLIKLSDTLSQLGYSNAKLARLLAERDSLAASLHEEHERLKRAQEIAHVGSWELDLKTNDLTWSDEVYRIFGLEPQGFRPTYEAILDHAHPDDRAFVDASFLDSLRENRDTYEIEHRIVRKSTGEIRFVQERCQHLRDGSGQIIRSLGMIHDITELKARNMELDAERLKWQRLIHGIADEVWACDAAGKVSMVNLATKTNMGLMDFEGKPLEETLQEIDVYYLDGTIRPDKESPLLRSLRGDVLRGEEIVRNRRTGTTRIRQYSAAPVSDPEGRIIGSVAVIRDVTEERQAEAEIRKLNEELEERVKQRTAALERANKELEAFSYSVSHDLKAPLRLISGFAALVEKQGIKNLTVKQRDSLETIQKQAAHMDELIRALLEFSRLTRKEPTFVSVDTQRMVEEVVNEQRQLLGEEAGRRVQVEIAGLPVVQADAILLRMVFTNLLSNAFKFTRTVTEPRIRIDAERKDGNCEFHVADNGVGFPKEQTEKLFKVFQRLHGAGEFEGSGIGLANVRKIIERHGGQVSAYGEEGKGATFSFVLPARS